MKKILLTILFIYSCILPCVERVEFLDISQKQGMEQTIKVNHIVSDPGTGS